MQARILEGRSRSASVDHDCLHGVVWIYEEEKRSKDYIFYFVTSFLRVDYDDFLQNLLLQ